jgi:hypothetical protein
MERQYRSIDDSGGSLYYKHFSETSYVIKKALLARHTPLGYTR